MAAYESRGQLSLSFLSTIEPIVVDLRVGVCSIAAIDLPIGLSLDGVRPVDALARLRLGPRRSTFFPTPVRAALDATDFETANAANRAASGKGLSIQAWNLVPKILEVDNLWHRSLLERLVEAHPEVSFAEMAGSPILSKKSSPNGADERSALLSTHLCDGSADVLDQLIEAIPTGLHVDAIDALALLWTARRVSMGDAVKLGGDLDALGRPMALHI